MLTLREIQKGMLKFILNAIKCFWLCMIIYCHQVLDHYDLEEWLGKPYLLHVCWPKLIIRSFEKIYFNLIIFNVIALWSNMDSP
jgi:hypothetical protein